MKDFHEFGYILPAALITLALSLELAVLPMLVPLSFLVLMALWGVTTYALLVFCSWAIRESIEEENRDSVLPCCNSRIWNFHHHRPDKIL